MEKRKSPLNQRNLGAISSSLIVMAFVIPPFIYLRGNFIDPFGGLIYSLADFLYGPVCVCISNSRSSLYFIRCPLGVMTGNIFLAKFSWKKIIYLMI